MRRKLAVLALILGVSLSGMIIMPGVASAANGPCSGSVGGFLNFPTWYKYLSPHRGNGGCIVNADFPDSIVPISLAVFEIVLRVAGIAAVFIIAWGGLQYIMSAGEPDKAKGGRTTVINALIGLLIAMLATAMVNIVGRNI